jgi:hypothetical protein
VRVMPKNRILSSIEAFLSGAQKERHRC